MFGAIEAGGTKIVCATGTSPHAISDRAEFPTGAPGETFQRIFGFFQERQPLDAIGVASFGPIDIDPNSQSYGAILNTPKPHWSRFSLREALAPLSLPLIFDTDVNGAAIAEQWATPDNLRTLAYVTVGTGIGVGIAVDGRSLSGVRHFEMGHLRPRHDRKTDAFAGSCPFHGDCFEGLASGSAIMSRWSAPLNELPESASDLIAAYLAELTHAIILSHMPDRVVFGGGVMKTPGLIEKIRKRSQTLLAGYIDAPALSGDWSAYITPPILGDDAGVSGALLLAARAISD